MTSGAFDIRVARTPEELETARILFREYQQWLGVDLCFQDFENELAGLPGKYAPPNGEIFIAYQDGRVAGTVAIRPHGELGLKRSEMKRMYVREDFRGQGLGRQLAEIVISFGVNAGYRTMVLDTLPHLKAARRMYTSMEFVETTAYYQNPLPGVVYMEKIL